MVRDLTVGKPGRILTMFALPMLVSVVFQQFYNMADNIVAGQFLGDAALNAVAICYPITMIYTSVALGINIGVNVVVSQLFGSHQHEKMKTAVSTSLLATAGLALVMTVLGLLFCRPLLALLNTPADLVEPTMSYLNIYTLGLLFILLYNTATGVFTSLGDTVTPLVFLVISSLSNVGVNILFVTTLGMNVEGLALATIICQAVAAAASLLVLMARLRSIPSEKYEKFSPKLLSSISKMAIPGICQKSFVSVGNLMVQSVVNSFAATVPGIIGGFSSATKLLYIVVYLNASVASAVAGFSAQNIGAGHMERLKPGLRGAFILCFAMTIPATLFFLIFPTVAMGIFVPAESVDIINAGVSYLRTVSPFIVILIFKQLYDAILQGAGAAREFIITTFSDLLLRVALAYILPIWMGYLGIWWAWPIGWIIGTAISVYYYRVGHWKDVHLLDSI